MTSSTLRRAQDMSNTRKHVIHIHVPKTGGTWFNRVMHEHLGAAFSSADHSTVEWAVEGAMKVPFWLTSGAEHVAVTLQGIDAEGRRIPNLLRPDVYLRVAICRNPFELLVSHWSHDHPVDRERAARWGALPAGPIGWDCINAIHGISSFDGFIKRLTDPSFPWAHATLQRSLHYQLLTTKRPPRVTVDYVLRNERLTEATRELLTTLGIEPNEAALASERSNNSSRHRDYRSYYTDELRELVEAHYARDLNTFGYNFDGSTIDASWFAMDPAEELPETAIDTYVLKV